MNKQSLKIILNLTSSSDYAGKVIKSYFFFLFSYNCETKSLIQLMSGFGGVVITTNWNNLKIIQLNGSITATPPVAKRCSRCKPSINFLSVLRY